MAYKAEGVPSDIRNRFESLNLHDCRLLGIRIERRMDLSPREVHLDLELLTGARADEWVPAALTFVDCAFARVMIDFWAKQVCADAIAESTCEQNPERVAAMIEEQNPLREQQQPLSELLIFSILLCPPGGELLIIARDFILAERYP